MGSGNMRGRLGRLLALPAYAGSDLDAVAQLLEQGQTEQAALQADQFCN